MARSSVKARARARRQALLAVSPRRAVVELDENGEWIDIWFPYSSQIKNELQELVQGARFIDKYKGGPKWRAPRTLETCENLRKVFGPTRLAPDGRLLSGLKIGDGLAQWARKEQQTRRNLGSLARAKDAHLKRLPKDSRIARAIAGQPIPELNLPPLPTGKPHPLMRKRAARPYQRADIKIMAQGNVMNANQPGVGKTIETLGSWIESDLIDAGPHLVIAPVKSLENVWLQECMFWLPDKDVYTDKENFARRQQVEEFLDELDKEPTFSEVLCLNYDWIRLAMVDNHNKGRNDQMIKQVGELQDPFDPKRNTWSERQGYYKVIEKDSKGVTHTSIYKVRLARRDHKGNIYAFRSELQERLFQVYWATVTVDEFHKAGLNNRNSLFSLGLYLLKTHKKAALSGTPMGGKPRKLWPVLHWLEPTEYTSEWRWGQEWLNISDNGHSKVMGVLKDGIEERFYHAHVKHIVRRLKLEALPGLPARVEQVVWCDMTPGQRKQYLRFERELEIKIEEERIAANNVLTEYMRLKQFANAKQTMNDGKPFPTEDSGKLEQLLEHLEENGIRKEDPEPGARAIVGSESSRMVLMVTDWLRSKGIECDALYGATKDDRPIMNRFKGSDPRPYVIVMTVQTGGVSLNLEEASSMHAIDETWNPDDLEQFFERGDRGTRTEPLRCYIYRTRGTIQEYIAEVNEGKALTNANVLDVHRRIYSLYKEAA